VAAASANAPFGDRARMIKLPGGLSLDFAVLNYAQYIKDVSLAEFDANQLLELVPILPSELRVSMP
jgi:hypothetical protein